MTDSSTDPGRPAAFFDLDGTLIPGSANIPLAKTAFKAGMVGKRELLRDLRNGASFLLSGASDARSAQVRDRILFAVQGHPASQVEALGDVFLPDLVASLRPQLEPVLAEHAARGEDRIVLSASPTEIVSRFAEGAGLTYGRGTTAGRDADGVYDGTLVGPFCYQDGKVEIMAEMAAEHGYDLSRSYAYTDSASDLPMLEAVGNPVVVHPEPELRAIAEERGWPIIETSSVPRTSLRSFRGITGLAGNAISAVATKASGAAKFAVSRARRRSAPHSAT
ncbi:MAG: HAD family hydrolase [Candidatus Nanopelagicales bacterium]